MTPTPNQIAGVGAGRTPEFIEMMQFGQSYCPARVGSEVIGQH
jgi:hypothetical protein